jgi:hypothetical protein
MHVTFDRYSLMVDGRRLFLRSGAFHYFRLPSPGLWRDRLLRLKRAGYNAVDLYFWWGYHSPAPGLYDFAGLRNVDYLLDLIEQVGLYLIARPGPYICAEVDGGGHPAWLLNRHDIILRCRQAGRHAASPEYLRYARQWYEQIVPRFARRPNLILAQIENEYTTEDLEPGYVQTLYRWMRELGVTVPIFHNDLWAAGCWADVVDIYGVDYYPITDFTTDWRTVPDLFLRLTGLEESLRSLLAAAVKRHHALLPDDLPSRLTPRNGGRDSRSAGARSVSLAGEKPHRLQRGAAHPAGGGRASTPPLHCHQRPHRRRARRFLAVGRGL